MANYFETIDYLRRIDSSPDSKSLCEEVRKVGSRYGLTHVIGGVVPTGAETQDELADSILFDNWSEDWVERYVKARFAFIDPILHKSRRNPEMGFSWAQAKAEFGALDNSRVVLDEARENGLAFGFCTVLRTFEGDTLAVSFDGAQMDLSPEAIGALNLTGAYAVCKALQFRGAQRPSEALTVRELDCVRWCAEGKTDWEISRILGIGESTVRTHIDKARAKFNAGNRVQLVAQCLRAGLIL